MDNNDKEFKLTKVGGFGPGHYIMSDYANALKWNYIGDYQCADKSVYTRLCALDMCMDSDRASIEQDRDMYIERGNIARASLKKLEEDVAEEIKLRTRLFQEQKNVGDAINGITIK